MRKIIHIDADCFFAAMEIRENPELRDYPVAVGGDPGRRGVISTCNYQARQYGVHSAMASSYAKRLCPGLVILKPNLGLYRQASFQMREIFSCYSDIVEPLSLDEAYLDVSNSALCSGSATLIAEEIRRRVVSELGITVSAGVAPVKYLAKIASDWRKPNGIFTITPNEVYSFVGALPLSRLPGVGKVTAVKLAKYGLNTCKDIREIDPRVLSREFGRPLERIVKMSKGIDDSPVSASRERKSISVEKTFSEDILLSDDLNGLLAELLEELKRRYGKGERERFVSKKFVKLKFDNFEQTTMETSMVKNHDVFELSEYQRLVQAGWRKQRRAVRLLGVGLRLAPTGAAPEQLSLGLT